MPNKPIKTIPWITNAVRTAGPECVEWPFYKTDKGYGQLFVNREKQLAHRFAFFLHHGRWPHPWVLHRCDNPPCVNPHHLFEGTPKDNTADAISKGRLCKGEDVNTAKLTEEEVLRIREEYQRGVPGFGTPALAKRYGVSRVSIHQIVTRKSWKHII